MEGSAPSDPQNVFPFRLVAHPGAVLLDSFPSPGWTPRTSALSWRKTTTHCLGLRPQKQVEQTVSSAHQPFWYVHSKRRLHLQPFPSAASVTTRVPPKSTTPHPVFQLCFNSEFSDFESLPILCAPSESKTTCTNSPDHRVSFPKSITWFIVPLHSRSPDIALNSSCPSLILYL